MTVIAMELNPHPENIHKKFIILTVRERKEGVSSPLKAFEYERIEVFERSDFSQVTGASNVDELFQHVQDSQEKTKSLDKQFGVGLVLIEIKTPDGTKTSLIRASPVMVRTEELKFKKESQWEDRIRRIINEGISIERVLAKLERI